VIAGDADDQEVPETAGKAEQAEVAGMNDVEVSRHKDDPASLPRKAELVRKHRFAIAPGFWHVIPRKIFQSRLRRQPQLPPSCTRSAEFIRKLCAHASALAEQNEELRAVGEQLRAEGEQLREEARAASAEAGAAQSAAVQAATPAVVQEASAAAAAVAQELALELAAARGDAEAMRAEAAAARSGAARVRRALARAREEAALSRDLIVLLALR
jgi:hypothetical protein